MIVFSKLNNRMFFLVEIEWELLMGIYWLYKSLNFKNMRLIMIMVYSR